MTMGELVAVKKCSFCGEILPLEEYYNSSYTRDGKARECKACHAAGVAVHRKANPEKYKKYWRRQAARDAGIKGREIDTWYDQQLEIQNGRCAMPDCQLPAEKNRYGRLYIDHDHETGIPRGLLCNRCNSFLGHYEKRYKLIEAYLEKYRRQ